MTIKTYVATVLVSTASPTIKFSDIIQKIAKLGGMPKQGHVGGIQKIGCGLGYEIKLTFDIESDSHKSQASLLEQQIADGDPYIASVHIRNQTPVEWAAHRIFSILTRRTK